MTVDIEAVLRRVVSEVFDAEVATEWSTEPNSRHVHRVRLTSPDGVRQAGLRASSEWFDVTVFDLGVSRTEYEYDDDEDEDEKDAALRPLALLARAYLRGEGCVEQRRGLLRSHPVLTVVAAGSEWELGRRTSRSRPLS